MKTEQVKIYTQAEVDEIVRKAFCQGWEFNEGAPLNTVVRVDRSRPYCHNCHSFPSEVKKMVVHPELENIGPAEYDLANDIKILPYDDQRNAVNLGGDIYQYLEENDILKTCFSLWDGEEIQKKGIVVFREIFGHKAVPLWKSAIQEDSKGNFYFPLLFGSGDRVMGKVIIEWEWFRIDFRGFHLAACFR